MPIVYKCHECGLFTDNQKVVCQSCASKSVETAPSASYNGDYTAALETELKQMFGEDTFSFSDAIIHYLAERLNSAVKAQQNCA